MKLPLTSDSEGYIHDITGDLVATTHSRFVALDLARRANAFDELLAFVQDSRFYDSYWRDKRKALLTKYGEKHD